MELDVQIDVVYYNRCAEETVNLFDILARISGKNKENLHYISDVSRVEIHVKLLNNGVMNGIQFQIRHQDIDSILQAEGLLFRLLQKVKGDFDQFILQHNVTNEMVSLVYRCNAATCSICCLTYPSTIDQFRQHVQNHIEQNEKWNNLKTVDVKMLGTCYETLNYQQMDLNIVEDTDTAEVQVPVTGTDSSQSLSAVTSEGKCSATKPFLTPDAIQEMAILDAARKKKTLYLENQEIADTPASPSSSSDSSTESLSPVKECNRSISPIASTEESDFLLLSIRKPQKRQFPKSISTDDYEFKRSCSRSSETNKSSCTDRSFIRELKKECEVGDSWQVQPSDTPRNKSPNFNTCSKPSSNNTSKLHAKIAVRSPKKWSRNGQYKINEKDPFYLTRAESWLFLLKIQKHISIEYTSEQHTDTEMIVSLKLGTETYVQSGTCTEYRHLRERLALQALVNTSYCFVKVPKMLKQIRTTGDINMPEETNKKEINGNMYKEDMSKNKQYYVSKIEVLKTNFKERFRSCTYIEQLAEQNELAVSWERRESHDSPFDTKFTCLKLGDECYEGKSFSFLEARIDAAIIALQNTSYCFTAVPDVLKSVKPLAEQNTNKNNNCKKSTENRTDKARQYLQQLHEQSTTLEQEAEQLEEILSFLTQNEKSIALAILDKQIKSLMKEMNWNKLPKENIKTSAHLEIACTFILESANVQHLESDNVQHEKFDVQGATSCYSPAVLRKMKRQATTTIEKLVNDELSDEDINNEVLRLYQFLTLQDQVKIENKLAEKILFGQPQVFVHQMMLRMICQLIQQITEHVEVDVIKRPVKSNPSSANVLPHITDLEPYDIKGMRNLERLAIMTRNARKLFKSRKSNLIDDLTAKTITRRIKKEAGLSVQECDQINSMLQKNFSSKKFKKSVHITRHLEHCCQFVLTKLAKL